MKAQRLLACAVAALDLACAVPALAQEGFPGGSVVAAVEQLKPGEFLWLPEIAPDGPILLIVSVASQRAILYRNGVPIAVTTVSTGRQGYRTPTGVFTILQKHVEHFSSIYDNAPMPYMQRLTWKGVALHGGQLPGYPASHGCIRLPHAFARLLYGVTALGMTVIVTDAPALPRLAPTRDPLPMADSARGGAQWHPERALSGPLSIIVSGADRRVVVLRDGREIGAAPVEFSAPVTATSAYVRRTDAQGRPVWLAVLPGEATGSNDADPDWSRFRVDPAFRSAVAAALVPGTTVVVTPDSLAPGAPVDLLDAEPPR
ncbi:L,D-transpeptidase family protein [Sphingomonas sp. UNC305MFCol5.2]|uniref:L,D-transpeptidase family protein n=1 Tax=Sphingomonas sp. UNC305MFCol5.2 TaxID=1449076 RepID=UPI00056BE198|nr:L,D-transpeptidase family protein [Sphingomonas sp. UNC305MFCol5.2]